MPETVVPPIPGSLSPVTQPTAKTMDLQTCNCMEEELFFEQNLFISANDTNSCVVVKGGLCSSLPFWEKIGTGSWIINIVHEDNT